MLRNKWTLTNKLGSGVHCNPCRQPEGTVPLLDCLTQVPIWVLVVVVVLVLVLPPAQVLILNRSPNHNLNLHLRNPRPSLGLKLGYLTPHTPFVIATPLSKLQRA